jgi:hypothetical protein
VFESQTSPKVTNHHHRFAYQDSTDLQRRREQIQQQLDEMMNESAKKRSQAQQMGEPRVPIERKLDFGKISCQPGKHFKATTPATRFPQGTHSNSALSMYPDLHRQRSQQSSPIPLLNSQKRIQHMNTCKKLILEAEESENLQLACHQEAIKEI